MKHKLQKASYTEWQASLFGACFIAVGLGALFADYFSQTWFFVLILIGAILHSWGMFKIHQRNNP